MKKIKRVISRQPLRIKKGKKAEQQAERYLHQKGLKTVCRNFHSPRGEIDLIMTEGNTLVFIEVRSKRSCRFGHPLETINNIKQNRIITTAHWFLTQHTVFKKNPSRFDAISLIQNKIHWVQNAFTTRP